MQYLTEEYLEYCSKMKPEEILEFLEDFRNLLYFSNSLDNVQEGNSVSLS